MNLYEPNTQDNLHQIDLSSLQSSRNQKTLKVISVSNTKLRPGFMVPLRNTVHFFLFRPLGYYGVAFTPLWLSKNYDAP